MPIRLLLLAMIAAVGCPTRGAEPPADLRPRVRDLGVRVGPYHPGPVNAITDVPGVRVGHCTVIQGVRIRTGVTAIVPHGGDLFQQKVPAAVVVGNGFGKLVGATQVEELGQLETPILLTNTLNVWEGAAALVERTLAAPGNENVRSVNPVVGETNDGYLNDIRLRAVRTEHFEAALRSAASGAVAEGSVGAGTGVRTMGFKGGIGTSSRSLPERGGQTVGVLVQTNYGGQLTIAGVPIGGRVLAAQTEADPTARDGSCMMVVATDAALDARQLKRLARRALVGMARTGASFSNGSGDYVIAFSTNPALRITPGSPPSVPRIHDRDLTPWFEAVADATEEAIYNALLQATTVRGRDGRRSEAVPIAAVRAALEAKGISAHE